MLLEFRWNILLMLIFLLYLSTKTNLTLTLIITLSIFSQYLENYLWVNYTPEVSSNAYIMSICCIVNEKFRENVPAWEVRKHGTVPALPEEATSVAKQHIHRLADSRSTELFVTTCFLHFLWHVPGFQEGTQSLSIFLQMCHGSCVGRRRDWLYFEGTNRSAGLLRPLL